jgi:hypothetical protein
VADSQLSLLEQVRSGTNRQLQLLAADGFLPLPPDQLIPLQVSLAGSADPEIAKRAERSLRGSDVRVVKPYLERDADPEVLAFFAAASPHPLLIEAILRRRDVPRPLLATLARRLPPELQETLLLRQDAILELPAILEALEENPQISPYAQRRIAEYRQHLLPQLPRFREEEREAEELSEAEMWAAVEVARNAPASGEVDEEKTKLSEGQIRGLPVPVRLKLARGAPRSLRSILLRDQNPQVALMALHANAVSEQEIEQIAASRVVVDEVLGAIARKREWVQRYTVAKNLVWNPRTPLPIAMRLITRMSVRDLRELGRDRNVADAVRSTALRLYRIKHQ